MRSGLAVRVVSVLFATLGMLGLAALQPTGSLLSAPAERVIGQPDAASNAPNRVTAGTVQDAAGVAVDHDGNVYVSDTYNARVVMYAPGSATATRVYGQPDLATSVPLPYAPFWFTAPPCPAATTANFCLPRAVAVDASNNLYVADEFYGRILVYPPNSTTPVRVYGQPDLRSSGCNTGGVDAATLCGPTGLTFDQAGDLYVTDQGNNRVLMYPPGSTTATRVYGLPDFTSSSTCNTQPYGVYCNPNGLAVDANGDMYVADTYNLRVLEYPAGSTAIGTTYTLPSTPNCAHATPRCGPYGLAFDSAGRLYVSVEAESSVLIFDPGSTSPSRMLGRAPTTDTAICSPTDTSSLCNVAGLTTDAADNLYVVNGSRVSVFPAGSATASQVYGQTDLRENGLNGAAAGPTTLAFPRAVAVDGAGTIYVADAGNHRVLVYPSASNTATRVIGQPDLTSTTECNTGPAGLCEPSGVALDQAGNLYVADTGNNRVLKFPPGSDTATQVYGQASFDSLPVYCSSQPVTASSLCGPTGVAVDTAGNLYVADTLDHRVVTYAPRATSASRVYLQPSLTTRSNCSANCQPTGVAVDAHGNVFIARGDVTMYPAGSTTAAWDVLATGSSQGCQTDASHVCWASGVAVDSVGDLYVADEWGGRVLFMPAGSRTASQIYGQPNATSVPPLPYCAQASPTTLCQPSGVAVDRGGNVLIADMGNSRAVRNMPSASGSTTSTPVPPATPVPPSSTSTSTSTVAATTTETVVSVDTPTVAASSTPTSTVISTAITEPTLTLIHLRGDGQSPRLENSIGARG